MKDPYTALKKARERRESMTPTPHPQPVLISTGPPKKISLLAKLKLANQARKVLSQAKSTNYTMSSTSLKTSIFGGGNLLILWANVASMLLDGNAATNPDWSIVIPS